MLEDPGLDHESLIAAIRAAYAIEALQLRFVRGHDLHSAAYVVDAAGDRYFAKVHVRGLAEVPLAVVRSLQDAGMSSVIAPIRTRTAALWHEVPEGRLVVYEFVAGHDAMSIGMNTDQWRSFGAALRAVHDSGLAAAFADRLPVETFGLPSSKAVRDALVMGRQPRVASPASKRLAALLDREATRIGAMLERADELGARLRGRIFDRVLCHGDIHAANVLVADGGRIFLVDWDGLIRAPRERDLLFVIGSRIARVVEPHEERWFFEGYGDVAIDREAIVYFRYERIFEDIGVDAAGVFGDPASTEASRAGQVSMLERMFGRGGMVETVERI